MIYTWPVIRHALYCYATVFNNTVYLEFRESNENKHVCWACMCNPQTASDVYAIFQVLWEHVQPSQNFTIYNGGVEAVSNLLSKYAVSKNKALP